MVTCLFAFALGSVHPSPPRPLLAHHAPRPLSLLTHHHALLRVRGGAAQGREHRAAHALGSERRELRQRLELRERRERRARRRAMYASCCGIDVLWTLTLTLTLTRYASCCGIVVLWIGGGTLFYNPDPEPKPGPNQACIWSLMPTPKPKPKPDPNQAGRFSTRCTTSGRPRRPSSTRSMRACP